jgi:glycosyltransferase involved in cell wall biosynthesis
MDSLAQSAAATPVSPATPFADGSGVRAGEPVHNALSVSVVIPTLGRPELLNACLDALVRCEWHGEELEIVVVDDGPTERTRGIVRSWTERMHSARKRVRYLASPGPHGPAAARNHGWRAARGQVIAFTDDDTQPDSGWLAQGVQAFAAGAEAAWGRIVMPIPAPPTDYERDANGLERAGFVTANCFCLRSLLERLGGFDERFRIAWREDSDLYFRLLETGARVVHVPEAVVVHPVRPAGWGVSIRQQRKVLFDALLYKKHPQLYRSRIRARPRWDYYGVVAALLAAIGAAMAGWHMVAAAAGAVWLAATAAFAWKRLRHTSKAPAHVVEMLATSGLIPPLAVFWRLYGAVRFRTLFL